MRALFDPARFVGRALALGVLAAACTGNGDRQVLPPVVLAMLDTTAPTYDDGQQQIFQVGREVPLPFRRPDDGERPRGQADPYPRPPFHRAADSRTTVRYTLTNLEDRQVVIELLIDPWNEFVRYVPGVSMIRDDEVLPNLSGIDRRILLPPKGRVEGIVTPDDMVELAADLTVAMALERRPPDPMSELGGPALYNRAFNEQNRSSEPDPVLAPWMPRSRGDVAAITGFDLGLRAQTGDESGGAGAPKVAVELVIDVDDRHGERVVMPDEDGDELRRPGTVLTPPAAVGP